MKLLSKEEFAEKLSNNVFKAITQAADHLGLECYVVGGYVRDLLLERPTSDIDIVVVGSGIDMAETFAKGLKGNGEAKRLSSWERAEKAIIATHANPSWKTVLLRTTKKGAISQSMPWQCASTSKDSENWLTLSMAYTTL